MENIGVLHCMVYKEMVTQLCHRSRQNKVSKLQSHGVNHIRPSSGTKFFSWRKAKINCSGKVDNIEQWLFLKRVGCNLPAWEILGNILKKWQVKGESKDVIPRFVMLPGKRVSSPLLIEIQNWLWGWEASQGPLSLQNCENHNQNPLLVSH